MAKRRASRGTSDSAERRDPRSISLERWFELRSEISLAQTLNMIDPEHPIPEIGRFVGVQYKHRGGFGVVFIVRDPDLQRDVAVKLAIVDSEETNEILLREARLMAKLSHPNVVTVHEVGRYGDSEDGQPFFAMEYIDGQNAEDFILRKPRPSWIEMATLYRGAGAGLAAAHERGLVHGDFKPGNILLDTNDWPRVADFGFGRYDTSGDEEHGEEGLRGTWAFMAPEALEGQEPDHLSDQFSFCVSLWLTFDDGFPFAVYREPVKMRKALNKQPWVHDDEVPEQLRAIARRGMSIDPRDRFPSMSAVVDELDRVIVELKAEQHAAQPAALLAVEHEDKEAAESSTQLEIVADLPQQQPVRARPGVRVPAHRCDQRLVLRSAGDGIPVHVSRAATARAGAAREHLRAGACARAAHAGSALTRAGHTSTAAYRSSARAVWLSV